MRALAMGGLLLSCLTLAACGGGSDLTGSSGSSGGSSTSSSSSGVAAADNVVAVTVDTGPTGDDVNTLFTTVTICVPGSTTQCQTIDHVQVDTASWGFRVLASVLTLTLPGVSAPDGNALVECAQFVDGYSWGSVLRADLQISGEKASSLPVQVIGDNLYTVPSACAGTGKSEDTVATFGANGIIGIGVFKQDCGANCATNPDYGFYYSCTTSVCNPSDAPLTSQVLNPIPLFAADNNGSSVVLPSVAAAGAATVTGSLVFGIDTESNNASVSGATVLVLDADGNFTTVYNGETLPDSFVDTGSNGLYFDDQSIPLCTSSGFSGFYCPTSTLNLTAVVQGSNAVSTTIRFSVANAENQEAGFAALPELGGAYSAAANPGSTSVADTFDWGLPFYFGRRVVAGIEGFTTSAATGPYVAF